MSLQTGGLTLALVVLAVVSAACGGDDDGGGSPFDTQRDIAFDVVRGDRVAGADTGADAAADEDVAPPPECEVPGDCVFKVRTPLQCEELRCDEGTCLVAPKADGAACDDANPCTSFDQCGGGLCLGGTNTCSCEANSDCAPFEDGDYCNGLLVCDTSSLPYTCVIDPDSVVTCDTTGDTTCMQTSCDPTSGHCVRTVANVGALCDDNDPCTGDTHCDADGACVGEERCQCRTSADCLPLEDDDQCNAALFCDTAQAPYVCRFQPGTEVRCSTANDTACRKNRCETATGACRMVNEPNLTTMCNDTNGCTVGDHCLDGVCQPGLAKDCDDDNPCTNDGCNPVDGQCQHVPNTQPCEGQYACSTGDVCDQGSCRRGATIQCDDGDPCTLDTCVEPTGCVYTPQPDLCPGEDVVAPPDAGGPDVVAPPDTGGPDVVAPPDTAAPDTVPADVSAPVDVVTWPTYAVATFRTTTLGWAGPSLCYDLIPNEPCIPMDGTLSHDIDERLAAAEPLVLLLRFEPLDVAADAGLVAVGVGACEAGAELDSCALLPEGPVTNYGAPVYRTAEACLDDPAIAAPCALTEAAPLTIPDLFLPPAGEDHTNPPFALVDATVHTGFGADLGGITTGAVHGFVTVETIEQTRTDLTGFGATDLALLFENTPPEDHGGATGWWVTLSFAAEWVATPAP